MINYNWEKVFNACVEQLKHYITKNNLKSMVLGVSGGIDSTVVAAIANKVSNDTKIPLIGFSLPSSTNHFSEKLVANEVLKNFCTYYFTKSINTEFQVVNKESELLLSCIPTNKLQLGKLQEGNMKARLRMLYLYHIASSTHGIVLDTGNLSEKLLGFWTLHGDEGDCSLLSPLYKTEVYKLAEWIKENYCNPEQAEALGKSIDLTPTDGNGVTLGGDMDQIAPGYTYNEVDIILRAYIDLFHVPRSGKHLENKIKADNPELPEELINNIINRIAKSDYKRIGLPINTDLKNCHD
jgi:NAD+ synthetase